jgi:hypothetical protein
MVRPAHVGDALLDGIMQRSTFLVIEIVATAQKNVFERHQLHQFTLRQVRRLVELDATVFNAGLQGMHAEQSSTMFSSDRHVSERPPALGLSAELAPLLGGSELRLATPRRAPNHQDFFLLLVDLEIDVALRLLEQQPLE